MDSKRLAWGEKELTTAGVSNALMESLWLLRAFGGEGKKFEDAIAERGGGKPLAYILGTQEFEGHTFLVSESVLIPRQETMVLFYEAVKILRTLPSGRRTLDLGTGSGILAISLALEDPSLQVEASDLSAEAVALAKENARLNGVAERITFFCSDLLKSVTGKFDMIVSNPPYIKTGDIPGLQRELHHEPFMALDGGPDGLRLIRILAKQALEVLHPRGFLLMEVGAKQSPEVSVLLKGLGYSNVRTRNDDAGLGRVVTAQTPL